MSGDGRRPEVGRANEAAVGAFTGGGAAAKIDPRRRAVSTGSNSTIFSAEPRSSDPGPHKGATRITKCQNNQNIIPCEA